MSTMILALIEKILAQQIKISKTAWVLDCPILERIYYLLVQVMMFMAMSGIKLIREFIWIFFEGGIGK